MRIWAILALACAGAAFAQDGQPQRVIVDPRAECHADAGADSPAGQRVTVGSVFYAAAVRSEGPMMWYLFGTDPVCWVEGRFTRISLGDAAANWTGILEYMNGRKDASLAEFIAVDEELARARVDNPRVEFRHLQMIQAALRSFDVMLENSYSDAQAAWLRGHGEYYDADGLYVLPASAFWKLYDANTGLPWAEEIAWAAASVEPYADDCAAECEIGIIASKDVPYWTRLPSGPHVEALLREAAEVAEYAAEGVCTDLGGLPAKAESVERVRRSLDGVRSPLKLNVLRYLGAAEGKCPGPR